LFDLIFHPEAKEEILSLDSEMQGKVIFALEKLEARGNNLRHPHTAVIRDGLFELRVGKKNIARTFFAFAKGKKIYVLRTFIKKSQKTPPSEIQLALKRLGEFGNDN